MGDINEKIRLRELFSILQDINVLLTKSFEDLNDTLWAITASLSNVFKTTKIALLLYDEKEEIFLPNFSFGIEKTELKEYFRKNTLIQKNLFLSSQHIINVNSKLQKEYKELFASFNLNNVIFEPITLKNKIIGWFLVADKNDKTPFSSNDIDLFNSIIPIYKVIIQNGILHREEQTKTKNLEHLRNIDRMLLIHKDLRQITDDIVESLVTIFSIEAAAILLLNKKKDALDIYCAKGISDKFVKKVKIKIGQGVTGICAQENKTIRINNVPSDERYISYPGSKTLSEMATPLTINEVVIGVLNIESIEKNKFSKNDEELFIDFALNTAVILKWVIENEK